MSFSRPNCPPREALAARAEGVDVHVQSCPDCRSTLQDLAAENLEKTKASSRALPGMRLAVGERIGRHQVVDFLGAGAMGEVYLAKDESLRRKVAVKILRSDAETVSLHARMVREAQAMARLSHPNVVAVYEVGDQAGLTFIAMEYVDGVPLREWLSTPRLWSTVVRLYLDAGRGLAAAHAQGLIHRDFKPDNVLVDREGRVRVADFGVAAELDDGALKRSSSSARAVDLRLTQTGSLIGTPAYMDAGMLQGSHQTTAASDQFAFCVSLVEGLAGARPMDGATIGALLAARLEGPSRRPPAGVPASVWKVLRRGLSVEPASRFFSMEPLLQALEAASVEVSREGVSRRRAALAAVVVALLVTVTGIASGRWLSERTHTFAELSMANATTELSRQRFKLAMQALATGVGDETTPLVEALKDDPEFSEAALQLAFLSGTAPAGVRREHVPYVTARSRRATLTPRDQQLLDALGPAFADPPDWKDAERRFLQMVEAHPRDAQAWGGLGSIRYLLGDEDGAVDAFREARRFDPVCTWGVAKEARKVFIEGRTDEARAALTRCLEAAPNNVNCAHRLGTLLNVEGQCEALDTFARAHARFAPGPVATWARLYALHGLGTPHDVVADFVRTEGHTLEPHQLAMWNAMATADFGAFLELDLSKGARPPPPTEAAFMRAQALLEAGEPQKAEELVVSTLRKQDVLERPVDLAGDATAYLIALARREGWISGDEARERRTAWVAGWKRRLEGRSWNESGPLVWVMAYSPARQPLKELATEAFEARAEFGALRAPEFFQLKSLEDGHPYLEDYGVLLMGAGRLDEASRALETATAICGANLLTVPTAGAAMMLAELRARRDDAAGVCQALKIVEREWGDARPRSVTVEKARALLQQRECQP